MEHDAKIYAAINDMKIKELGAVILGAGYELPKPTHYDTFRDLVRSLYQDGTVTTADILTEYSAA